MPALSTPCHPASYVHFLALYASNLHRPLCRMLSGFGSYKLFTCGAVNPLPLV